MTSNGGDKSQTGLDRENNQRDDINEEGKKGVEDSSQDPTADDAMQKRKQELADAAE